MSETFQLLHILLWRLFQSLHPFLAPCGMIIAWGIVALGVWSVWAAARDALHQAQRMHQVPCANCRYFSGDRHLKCPVHPYQALSELAIGCTDFESVDPLQRHLDTAP